MNQSDYKFTATMLLPANGKQYWTDLMQGKAPVAEEITVDSPIVMASALYTDGTFVIAGVLKSDAPTDYNIVFAWVYDKDGNKYPGWPIDLSDNEDFFINTISFSTNDSGEDDYLLVIKEA
ncbi:MAG: hypothetical protein H6Q17_1071 [Bacteroidetes bacterium]|nr:hypothetical protein [Bacteroidota bacterium]